MSLIYGPIEERIHEAGNMKLVSSRASGTYTPRHLCHIVYFSCTGPISGTHRIQERAKNLLRPRLQDENSRRGIMVHQKIYNVVSQSAHRHGDNEVSSQVPTLCLRAVELRWKLMSVGDYNA